MSNVRPHMNPIYGPHVRNLRVIARITQLLPLLEQEDQRKFQKKFRSESAEQVTHTFRELVLGAFLLNSGFIARYEVEVSNKTPDWLLHGVGGEVLAVIDQLTFHQSRELDDEMNRTVRAGSAGAWWLPDNGSRLYQKLHAKAETYEALATQLKASSVVAIFGDAKAVVETDELQDVLQIAYGGGLFANAPWLSGVLYFEEAHGNYNFRYFKNSAAVRPLSIADGEI